jgi:hypothetical protein
MSLKKPDNKNLVNFFVGFYRKQYYANSDGSGAGAVEALLLWHGTILFLFGFHAWLQDIAALFAFCKSSACITSIGDIFH